MNDVSIVVENVSKVFKLPHEKHSSLKSVLVNLFRRNKKGYELQEALKDVSFEIKKGEFFGIVGRNGSGKSTLLKLLAGIYTPSAGNIQVSGKLTPFIELGVGFNQELTGRENVFLNGALLGFNRKEMQLMYKDIVKFAELEKFMDQKLKNYSSGMQVRLAFSIAIRAKSDILLIDEVLAVGDVSFQAKCFNYFRQLKEAKQTVVFVSHDMSSIQEFCDRVVVLNQGTLTFNGSPKDAIKNYTRQVAKETQKHQNPFSMDQLSSRITGMAKISNGRIEDGSGKKLNKVKENDFTIKYDVEFLDDAIDPNPGLIIINEHGLQICSANALWKSPQTGRFKKGEKVTFAFSLKNLLESGHYKVIANILYNDTVNIYDWNNDLLSFTCNRSIQTGSVINAPYDFRSIKEKK